MYARPRENRREILRTNRMGNEKELKGALIPFFFLWDESQRQGSETRYAIVLSHHNGTKGATSQRRAYGLSNV